MILQVGFTISLGFGARFGRKHTDIDPTDVRYHEQAGPQDKEMPTSFSNS